MKKLLLLACGLLVAVVLPAQSFEVTGLQENYRGFIGELITAPLTIKNTSQKAITLVIRKSSAQIGGTQRYFICLTAYCETEQISEDLTIRLEPGQSFVNWSVALEAGLVPLTSIARYRITNVANPAETVEVEYTFITEEKPARTEIFNSRLITIHDVYPNPVTDYATINYRLSTETVRAKIVIHNILGSRLSEIELPFPETQVKIRADDLSGGIYFYTLYLDNEGVMTRKLIVKK
ncbi:MAG: T9SS type A sorting domain-containing protein [Flammeovirgaceae bacterium]|nr:MAG: T9SS type A sorting domain-containing protein [Flammeovirgaceae bacterium]